MPKILVIDDNDTLREGVVAVCARLKHDVFDASSGQAGVDIFDKEDIDLVVTDLKMDGMDGIGVLKAVKERSPDAAVVIMTAYGTIETAVEAMQLGAYDFVTKPFSPDVIRAKIGRALDWRALQQANDRLQQTNIVLSKKDEPKRDPDETFFHGMVGASAEMQKLFEKVEKVARSDTNVHIFGESGTGKELVAQAIHDLSQRASGPIIRVNCGAIPETLIESELFGHERGAFTGAVKRKLGRFELAHEGTIFLDEIGELSPAMQVKLLRVLQEKEFERVGGEKPIKVDVRVVSATNRDLEAAKDSGEFREDLFYRLHIVPLTIPPLRSRTDDIIPLARFFLDKLRDRTRSEVAHISPEAESRLRSYHYPGNVRELENIIEQAMVFASPPEIDVDDLPPQVSGTQPQLDTFQVPAGDLGLNDFLEAAERQMILRAYEKSGGVKTETARLLKIKTSALYYKLEKYGIGTVAGRDLSQGEDGSDTPPD